MSQKRTPIKMEAPQNWLKMVENIRHVRRKYPAPVDSMGCSQAHSRSDKTTDQRFQILLSLMLSSQTKDPITWAAVQKLKEAGLGSVKNLLLASEKDIEDLIHPVGFYRRKAIYLKEAAKKIAHDFNGDIPDSVEALCTLKGVGPKMAHLCMQEAWNVNSGIGVDTHVHRISARLGWVPKSTKTPEQTREALESWMPPEHWREINHLLVGFGQTICTPLRPKCGDCANNEICPSSSVTGKRDTPATKAAAAAESAGVQQRRQTRANQIKKEKIEVDDDRPLVDTSRKRAKKEKLGPG